MRQHRALGTSGGAGSVENGREVVVRARHRHEFRLRVGGGIRQRTLAVASQRFDPGANLRRDRTDALRLRRVAHHQRGLGVGDEIFQLVQRVGGIERQIHRAGAHRGEIEHQARHRFFGLGRDAIAGLDAAIDQHIRHLPGAGNQLAIADARSVDGFDREAARIVKAIEQAGKQVGVRSGFAGRVHASFRSAGAVVKAV